MKIQEAIKLIEFKPNSVSKEQVWADLGCGSGTFTLALASLLPYKSIIYAIDKNTSSLDRIPKQYDNVSIIKQQGDFEKMIPFDLDGIIMANSLHYLSNKVSFIRKIKKHFKGKSKLLIIEYDSDAPNTWVPYPINYISLKTLFEETGFSIVKKLGEHPSLYRRSNIYSALIEE
jgi:ubiquinone/menaquinone biosynthesis C-methylase UbiE